MSKLQEVKDKIINQEFKGTLYPDFEQVLDAIGTLEQLKDTMNLGLADLEHELSDKEETEIKETISNLDNTINELAESIFLEKTPDVPENEQWLYENPDALKSVKQGLKEAGEGKLVNHENLFIEDEK